MARALSPSPPDGHRPSQAERIMLMLCDIAQHMLQLDVICNVFCVIDDATVHEQPPPRCRPLLLPVHGLPCMLKIPLKALVHGTRRMQWRLDRPGHMGQQKKWRGGYRTAEWGLWPPYGLCW